MDLTDAGTEGPAGPGGSSPLDGTTSVLAVACGPRAAPSLVDRWATELPIVQPGPSGPNGPSRRADGIARHLDLVVAWDPACHWVDHCDDGDVLAVVDGNVHDPLPGAGGAAALVARRYRDLGARFARGLLGDVVAVVLDRRQGRLLVARDPLGARPWYRSSRGGDHAGATDVATLARLGWVDTEIDTRTAIEHLAARSSSLGRTFHEGIRTLLPGHTWVVEQGRARTVEHHRWALEPDLDIGWDDAVERCRELLDLTVLARLGRGEPVAFELSGGLDSSAVVGTAARRGIDDLVAARLVFEGAGGDERSYSNAVATHWSVPLVSEAPWWPGPDERLELARRIARPLPDPHFVMFAGLHRRLRADGRLLSLTGLGGDDAFVTSSLATRLVGAIRLRRPADVRAMVGGNLWPPRRAWTVVARPTLHHLAPWRGDRLPEWVSGTAATAADLPALFRQRAPVVTGIDAIDERIANLTSGYDAAVLERQAIVSDLAGRRGTHPFLDPRFIEATYGLDPSWPARQGHTRALQVAAYRDRLPPLVADRRSKAEFSEVFWPQLLADDVLHRVRTGPLAERGWLDRGGFDRLVVRARGAMPNAAIPLARCVSLDEWLRAG